MNNLLRTLTESNAKPSTDLRLLLNTVKEGRKQGADNKLSDSFYDALEGLLTDLKSLPLDNRDAEAFLKPVSKTEVPDYYDVILNPMDFQTMSKKVKQKQYKSKREFKDDLELIWSNCYTYNASDNHPLRQCVKRLKAKADRLLRHITDRRERTDPSIPYELGAEYTGLLPKMNGVSPTHTRSSSHSSAKGGTPGMAAIRPSPSLYRQPTFNLNIPFPESAAITRTPEGMAMFFELDAEVAAAFKKPNMQLMQRLKRIAPPSLLKSGGQDGVDAVIPKEENPAEADEVTGDKRKLSSPDESNSRPRKRARFVTPYSAPPSPGPDQVKEELSDLWWAAAQSDTLLANGVPPIPFGPSSSEVRSCPSSSSSLSLALRSASSSLVSSSSSKRHLSHENSSLSECEPKAKRRKKTQDAITDEAPPTHVENPKALLNMMNTNIKTMRRIRHTHAKFAALNATTLANEEAEEGASLISGGIGSVLPMAGPSLGDADVLDSSISIGSAGEAINAAVDDEIMNEKLDERPFTIMRKVKTGGKGKERERMARFGGVDIGEKNAWSCLQWTNRKILEHVGFQGTSQVSLDVLSGILAEYISNVGRTIKFLSDKYAGTMTPEELILHTLFESGTSKVQDLERYIRDDVERYSSRLNELERKIIGAYREATAGETLEDEGLFMEEDEDEAGALAVGDFADMLGEDYLGLRELGIAAEFGMSSLTIPKKLLKSKKSQLKPVASKPDEPPPLYPPPLPFIPLASNKVDDQIGLLKDYYVGRFTAVAAAAAAAPKPSPPLPGLSFGVSMAMLPGPSLAGPSLPGPNLSQPPSLLPGTSSVPTPVPVPPASLSTAGLPSTNAIVVPGATASTTTLPAQTTQRPVIDWRSLPKLTLPDDTPSSAQVKMGPLGQITKGGAASGAGKKKGKGVVSASAGVGAGGVDAGSTRAGSGGAPVSRVSGAVNNSAPGPMKKQKGATGVGTGNGRKKKGPNGAASGDGGTQQENGGQGSPYPPVVVASA